MNTVGWIEVHRKPNGGVRYGDLAKQALSKEFAVDLIFPEAKIFRGIRLLRVPESLLRLLFVKGKRDVWVRDIFSVLSIGFDRTEGKNVVVIYHHDFSGFPFLVRPFFALFHRPLFFWRLQKADAIVVISEFWRKYFVDRGYRRVIPISMGFDFREYDITEEEVRAFRQKYKLADKPIVYLGNCQKAKGVVEAYHALQEIDAHLVTSGTQRVRIAAQNFDVSWREYLCLLRASSVVVAMSKFKEGWCITAHEAMFMKTPVIGSGKGGMRELLEGGGQIICEDFSLLRESVTSLLNDGAAAEKLGEQGYQYAKQFPLERFEQTWLEAVKQI
jgi:glycosyltransferase involved in cell wall biosynthesis